MLVKLSAADRALLWPHLSLVSLVQGEALFHPGDDVGSVHFPCDHTLVSLNVVRNDGQSAETELIGREGAVGGLVSRGPKPAFARAVVQIPGDAWRIDVEALDAAKAQSTRLADTFARYADCLLSQLLQSVACNQHHSLEQRMARKLLAYQNGHGDAELPLTQEHLSRMLGATRTYVTKTATEFQARGLISYARGRVRVLDRAGLEKAACRCQLAVRKHYEHVLPDVLSADVA
ncbi:Crp/Fnr family transcriptional regulator [Rubellimicrobium rubrum]|uniref:Crp/Fnr family transcriptional regulator n=1 Tax=Rubellimicrobium rubrum TaxID=2585369 RepID=UPI00159BE1AD|nr:Crp/Fnr family transcriptional regulator [Rubellimicrobium rubrum]